MRLLELNKVEMIIQSCNRLSNDITNQGAVLVNEDRERLKYKVTLIVNQLEALIKESHESDHRSSRQREKDGSKSKEIQQEQRSSRSR